ncbi:uncharacterized protein LOC111394946 [Olea europaea var. sylvestris]|uniref:uncharacterized protein LOC111394946 n=1 Tax=Olea europaea var. sylvestris TaxID=158386 RepID=UPI000C1D14F4|nr:uncharacterized protein LOC111394946 [Olea europaea var. sylvestris]
MPKMLASTAIDNMLKSNELEVNFTLIPTEAELEETYWKELKLIVEEDESASRYFKRDNAKHDVEPYHAFHQHSSRASQPPPFSHEMNIVDLFRIEMKNLREGDKQSYQLDLIGWRKWLTG